MLVHTARFSKYVRPFLNIIHETVKFILCRTAEKVYVLGFFLVRNFPQADQENSEYSHFLRSTSVPILVNAFQYSVAFALEFSTIEINENTGTK